MKLKSYVHGGGSDIVLNDDASDEEIAEALILLATTEPGNGSGRIFYRKKGNENERTEKDIKKRT